MIPAPLMKVPRVESLLSVFSFVETSSDPGDITTLKLEEVTPGHQSCYQLVLLIWISTELLGNNTTHGCAQGFQILRFWGPRNLRISDFEIKSMKSVKFSWKYSVFGIV